MFKINNKDTRMTIVPVSLLLSLTYFTPCSNVSIVNFKQVNGDWVLFRRKYPYNVLIERNRILGYQT